MEFFAALGIIALSVVATPAVLILAVAFVYVRQQRGQPVTIQTGLTAYAVLMVAVAAIVVAVGIAAMLRAATAEIDGDYTYGPGLDVFGLPDDFEEEPIVGQEFIEQRQKQDLATGVALLLAGGLIGVLHFYLRGWLADREDYDHGVAAAIEVLVAIGAGLFVLLAVSGVLDQTISRAIADADNAPGGSIASMWAAIGLWLVYAWRALTHLRGSVPRSRTDIG